MTDYRIENDSMGEVRVPQEAMYGAQTQRALETFQISGIRFSRAFIAALGLLKGCAADVNAELGLLDHTLACVIRQAADEVAAGIWDGHFPLDIFQTGSGTSTNMNANEVIATRAAKLLKEKGSPARPHPNDHVNMGQSSNDIIPSAIHLSAFLRIRDLLMPALRELKSALELRAEEFRDVVKTGRTHLMDAVPLRFGQELGGWAYQVGLCIERIERGLPGLSLLAAGGTAVGTGVNTHPEFGRRMAEKITERTGGVFREAPNHFAAQSSMDAAAGTSADLKTAATALTKLANDLRLMNSGPYAGFGEITLQPLQPGSSIMPRKVNPVVCEAAIMACVQVMANDLAVSVANSRGEFQLNVLLPLIAHNLLQSIELLGNAAALLAGKGIAAFSCRQERIADALAKTPVLVTVLSPIIGYDKAAEIAKKAEEENRSIRSVAAELTDIPEEELEKLLDPHRMTGPG